eukprot:751470-Hanusia_phi.AAC.2
MKEETRSTRSGSRAGDLHHRSQQCIIEKQPMEDNNCEFHHIPATRATQQCRRTATGVTPCSSPSWGKIDKDTFKSSSKVSCKEGEDREKEPSWSKEGGRGGP